jgi:hypothetical protein
MTFGKLLLCLPLLVFAMPAEAADLSALTAALAKVRATHGVNRDRDAGPELNTVKHALRDWIEPQLPAAPQANAAGGGYLLDPQDLTALGVRLSAELDAAGLTCGHKGALHADCGDPNGMENERGYVDRVRVTRFDNDHYLLVVTGVGVLCGFDESAYLYDQDASHRWRLLLSIEQDKYDAGYAPENFLAIDVSPSDVAWNDPTPPPLVTAVGTGPWCSSNWRGLNTRLWRTTHATQKPHPILDREDELYIGYDFVAAARLTQDSLLVQFTGGSIDGDVLIRTHVIHYAIGEKDRLTRIAPVALNPGDFFEEWATSPWAEASKWLAPGVSRRALARLHASKFPAEFDGPPKQCRRDPGLWQVNFADTGTPADKTGPRHVLIRWAAPYDFSLVAVGEHPFAGCDKAVTQPSDIGTLFPMQGWTP